MAKFAVLFFAAFALQAVFAGVIPRPYYNYKGLEGYTNGQFEGLVGQIQEVTRDFATLEDALPNNRQVYIMLTVQYREFAQYIDELINRLKLESGEYNVSIFEQIVSELREIQVALRQVGEYTDVSKVDQIKKQYYIYLQKVAHQIEKFVQLVPVQTPVEQTQVAVYVREILKDFLTYVQHVYFQFRTVIQYGQTGQYYHGLEGFQGYQRLPGYQGPQGRQYYGEYGYPKFGQYYYGGKYYGGRQMLQTPQQLISEIEIVARQLSVILQDTTYTGQQVSQVISVQARQFAQIIKNIIVEIEGQVSYKIVDTTVQQVIERLREVQLSLQRVSAYTTFTAVRQLKAQFDSYIQTVVTEIQRLVLLAQQETQGEYYVAIKNILNALYDGVQTIYYQLREVAQYRQGYGYDYGKYDQGYGYGKYDQYGYGKYYPGYPYEKYDQLYGKYDQGYGYGKLNKYFQDKYGLRVKRPSCLLPCLSALGNNRWKMEREQLVLVMMFGDYWA
ncbi:hypothetical protein ILUMI_08613 [Ignelater luminosus]|uniref:Uncharacterized protein n=1 Tax=Ignelater luminosus TaxID=2038154 RepID=A0A8K0D1K5_IGNLU|nr:hypothetical protein ILUMI_08613 [Ignelater luminosus]